MYSSQQSPSKKGLRKKSKRWTLLIRVPLFGMVPKGEYLPCRAGRDQVGLLWFPKPKKTPVCPPGSAKSTFPTDALRPRTRGERPSGRDRNRVHHRLVVSTHPEAVAPRKRTRKRRETDGIFPASTTMFQYLLVVPERFFSWMIGYLFDSKMTGHSVAVVKSLGLPNIFAKACANKRASFLLPNKAAGHRNRTETR